jgi:DNA repair exonuclease SbcCD ATPase subunit
MRVSRLILHDFLNHAHSELELSGLTVVAGGNNAGKSSIKDALQFLLTGTARTTDRRGAGAEDLKRVGGTHMEVTGNLDVGGREMVVTRSKGELDVRTDMTWGGKLAEKQSELHKLLGADGRVIRACLHAGSLPELPPAEQEELLFDLMGLEFSPAAIVKLLEEHGCEARDTQLLWAQGMDVMRGAGDAKLPSGPYSFEVFKLLNQEAYNARKETRKASKLRNAAVLKEEAGEAALIQAIPALAGIEDPELKATTLEAQLATLRSRRDALVAQVAKLQDRPDTEGKREELTAELRELEAELETAAQWESSKAELFGTQELVKLTTRMERAREKADQEVGLSKAKVKALLETAATFKKRPTCPLMGRECPLKDDAKESLVRGLQNRAKLFKDEDLAKAAESLAKTMEILTPLRELNANKGRDQATIQTGVDRVRAELRMLTTEVAEKADTEALELELAELTARVEAAPVKIQTVRTYGTQRTKTVEARTAAETAQAELDSWERLCKALGPKGIRGHAMQEPLKKLTESINTRLHEYSPGHRIELLGADGFELRVYGPDSGDKALPIKGLSTSERLRVGVALQDAFCHLTGLRFLLVDNVDMLEPVNLACLMETLAKMAKDYDSIVVLAPAGSKDEALGAPPARTYWVEHGVVSLLEEEVVL